MAFTASDSGAAETTEWLWPFLGVAIGLTVGVVMMWYFRSRIDQWRLALVKSMQRQKMMTEMQEKAGTTA